MKWSNPQKLSYIPVIGITMFFFHYGMYWAAHWLSKWAILAALLSIWYAVWVGRRTTWVIAPILSYMLFSGILIGMGPDPYHSVLSLISLIALEKNALYACIVLLLFGWVLTLYRKVTPGIYLFFFVAFWVSTLHTVLLARGGPAMDGLYSGNPSMNGCLIAALLPLIWAIWEDRLWGKTRECMIIFTGAIATLTIWRTGASVPIGVLGVALAAYLVSRIGKKYPVRALSFIALTAVALAGGGYFLLGSDFLDNNGRFRMWLAAYHWWVAKEHVLFGAGLGSAQILLPLVQLETFGDKITQYFLWLHNDWGQVFFELGVIGFILAFIPWAWFLKKSWKYPDLFASYSAFSVMALMNYPLRLPIHAFSWFLVVLLILKREKTS